MSSSERAARLCLLFESGPSRFLIEATRVAEVAAPDGGATRFRGVHALHDASLLLGGEPEERPGVAVVLDVSPTLVLRVRKVRGVADLARATFFQIPPGMGDTVSSAFRGAFLFERELYLELAPEKLAPGKRAVVAATTKEAVPLTGWVDRALVFESQGTLHGIGLPLVSQVVPAGDAFCALPAAQGPVAGLFPHGQALYPIYSVPALRGMGTAKRESFFVLSELAGQIVGLSATRVLGVHGPFTPASGEGAQEGEFRAKGVSGNVHFLDFQRMFY